MQHQRIVESIDDRAHALVRQQRIELACGFQALVRRLKLPCLPSRSQCGLCHLGGVLVGGRQVGDSKRPAAQLWSHTATRRGRRCVVRADDDGQLLARSDILPQGVGAKPKFGGLQGCPAEAAQSSPTAVVAVEASP